MIANTNKKPARDKTQTAKRTELAIQTEPNQTKGERHAKVSLSASYMSAILADSFTQALLPDVEIGEVAKALKANIATVQAGDMASIEAMLIGQAQALQTMFVSLGRQAASKTSLQQYTAFMNLALKAQSQSRATIQALVELKYPKQATFVKQANIANGHQQINNGKPITDNCATNTHAPAHAREIENQPNELIEVNNGSQDLDNRATQTTIAKDKAMATVATQHRRTND